MKIFIHGKGDLKTEICNFLETKTKKYYSKHYDIQLLINDKNKIDKKIKCTGFSTIDDLENLNISKIKNHYHLICSSKKRKEFFNFINDNNLKTIDSLIVNTPYLKKKNKIENGTIIFHSFLGVNIFIDKHVYVGLHCDIANNAVINKLSMLYQRVSIGTNAIIGENTIIASNTFINKSVKIGNNCYIGPNQNIIFDIPDNCMFVNNKIIRGLYET